MKKIDELDLKILVVDDEEIIRDSFMEYLELYDFEVIDAQDGLEGFDKIVRFKPDLVIMDLRMPKVDGFELLKKISSHNSLLPVIVISATGAIQDAVDAVRMGAWDFLIKPLSDFSFLDYAIERVMEKHELIVKNLQYQENLEQLVKERTKELQRTNEELSQANEILKINKEKMELALSGGNLGLWDLDLKNRKMNLSPHVFEMLDFEWKEVEEHYDFWLKQMGLTESENIMWCGGGSKKKDHFECEYRIMNRQGEYLWILNRGKILERDDIGSPNTMTGTILNITDRKHAEDRIINLNKELEIRVKERTKELEESLRDLKESRNQLIQSEKLASLGRMVAGVAHEINTPMGITVSLASNIMERTLNISEAYKTKGIKKTQFEEYLNNMSESSKMVLSNAEKASRLIRSFKKVVVEESHLEMVVFNLHDYINDVIISLNPKMKKFGHEISVDIDKTLRLKSYPGIFSQITTNLIINSLKHGFDKIEKGIIHISAFMDKDDFIFKYCDNGVGISEENRKKIFEPFFTTKRNEGGTGLGLNIVFNLVTVKLNGKIKCESGINKGTCFTIKIGREIVYE